MEQFLIAVPVVVTLAIMQVIKIRDPEDKIKKWYSLIALAIGLVVGYLFTADLSNWQQGIRDGIQNAAFASLAWSMKKGLLDPAGLKLPGDAPKKEV